MADPSAIDLRDFVLGGIITPVAVVIGLVSKVIVPGWIYRDVVKERDDSRVETKTMNDAIKDEVIPLVTRNLDLLKAIEPRIAPPSVNLRDPT
jgi:hypothetical protein